MSKQESCQLTAPKAIVLATMLAIALTAPNGSAQEGQDLSRQLIAERNAELDALKKRAASLAPQVQAHLPAPNKSGAMADWAKLLADFDQWAQKFHAPTQYKSLPAYVPDAEGKPLSKKYPLAVDGPPGIAGYFCLKDFSRSSDAEFVYKCYKE